LIPVATINGGNRKAFKRVGNKLNIFKMKKLEDFICNKVEVDSIYGGRVARSNCDTLTLDGHGGGSNDGDDSDWAECL
jgi:hypothetical protein